MTLIASCKKPGAMTQILQAKFSFQCIFGVHCMVVLILNCNEIDKIDSTYYEKGCDQLLSSVDWSLQQSTKV